MLRPTPLALGKENRYPSWRICTKTGLANLLREEKSPWSAASVAIPVVAILLPSGRYKAARGHIARPSLDYCIRHPGWLRVTGWH